MKSRGFTLIELLVVIAIIGLLATLSVVSFSTSRDKARIAKGQGFSGQILRSIGDEMTGRWEFDECSGAPADSSGFGNNGVMNGGVTWSTDTSSSKGCALLFNGSTGYVQVADSPRYDMSSFTVSAWIKTPDAGTGRRRIASQQDTTYWVLSLEDNFLGFLSSRDVQPTFVRGNVLNDNKWHHVTVAREAGKRLYWYVDGSLVGTHDITDTGAYQVASDLFIGRHAASAAQYFNGLIDEVRIYSKSLTAADVHRMYAEGVGTHLARE